MDQGHILIKFCQIFLCLLLPLIDNLHAYRATVHYNVGNISGEGSTSHLKRKLDEDNSIEVGEAMEEAGGETMEVDNDNPILLHSQKKFCSKEHIQPSNAENLEDHDLNFPLQGEVGLPCLVKVRIARGV